MEDAVLRSLDLIAVPTFVVDVRADGQLAFRYLNRAHEAMTGLRSIDVAGRTPAELFPARLAQTLTSNYMRVVSSGEAYSYEELLDLDRTGSGAGEHWWQTTLMPVVDAGGAVVRIIGTAVNITEHKRSEIERLEQFARALALNDEIEETIALAAHDLRSPLQAMQSMVRLLKKDFVDLDDGKLEIVEALEAIGTKTAHFVEDMLRYRETGGVGHVVTRFDLGHVLSDIVAVLDPMSRHLIHFHHIEIEGDALVLQIVLRNLVDNAIRHAGKGYVMMAVDVVEADPGILTFTVGDDGHGLSHPEEITERRARPRPGTGYGLRGVRRLVRWRGGDIWACQPIFSSGATIQFTVPGRVLSAPSTAAERHAA